MRTLWNDFDLKGNFETPVLILCNPQRNELCAIGEAKNIQLRLKLNDLSELSFQLYQINRKGNVADYYDSILKDRVITAQHIGRFIIESVSEEYDGTIPCKQVKCISYESVLNRYKIGIPDNLNIKFYDPVRISDTVMGKVLEALPEWKIGQVEHSLWNLYRTFDLPSNSLYEWLMDEAAKAYDCIFVFDTIDLSISAYPSGAILKQTDIVLSLDNLIKSVEVETSNEEIITELSVKGNGDLGIYEVNPLGTNYVYDFDYYMHNAGVDPWMSAGLVSAIEKWQKQIQNQSVAYANLLTNLKTLNAQLLVLESDLSKLQTQKEKLELVRDERITQGSPISDITSQINAYTTQIISKKKEIDLKKQAVNNTKNNLQKISSGLTFEKNFTPSQLLELHSFIKSREYTNSNFAITGIMTPVDIQDMSRQLYQQGLKKIKELSSPTYTFTIDALNFIFIKKFQPFMDQLSLGSTISIEVTDGYWVEPILLELDINYENPNDFQMTFSNCFKIRNGDWIFTEYLQNSSKTSTKVSDSAATWNKATSSGVIDYVSDMMKHGFDVAKTSILNADNQSFVIDAHGMLCRRKTGENSYSPEQLKTIHNLLVFTDDAWNTVKLALGKILMPDGNYGYGINTEVILGKLVATNQLWLTNENNTFKVDASGAELINAYLKLISKNGLSQIVLDPNDNSGIRIQTKPNGGSAFQDNFFVDMNGYLVAQNIKVKNGEIGGFILQEDKLYSKYTVPSSHGFNHMIELRIDGSGRLGLLTWRGGEAWFDGNIYAKNLDSGGLDHSKVDTRFDKDVIDNYNRTVSSRGQLATKGDIPDIPEIDLSKYVSIKEYNRFASAVGDNDSAIRDLIQGLSSRISALEKKDRRK